MTIKSDLLEVNLKIRIRTIDGKMVTEEIKEVREGLFLDVSYLSSGIYFLNITDGKGNMATKKFVKK